MHKNNKKLQRTTRNLAMFTIALIGSHIYGQFDFTMSTAIGWNEQHGLEGDTGGASLANLNTRIDTALSDATDTTLCYVMSGTPTNALTFSGAAASCSVPATEDSSSKSGKRSLSPNWLVLRSGRHVDYELGATQLLTISGYDASGIEKTRFEVTLVITDYDERPMPLPSAIQIRERYWVPDDSETFLIADLFRDPDGSPVYFDLSDASTDVWVCDTANGGDFLIEERPVVPERALGLGSAVTFTGGDSSTNCSVSNLADPTASPAPDPNPGERGSGGNRVVSTKKTGPLLEITADSLADDTDGDGIVSDRGSGTYAASVYIRVWSGSSEAPLSSTGFAVVNILVKVGANNTPQFAGGATGFEVVMMEGNDETDPMPGWVAGDLDSGGSTNDSLNYSLNPNGARSVGVSGGSIALKEYRGDNPATTEIETDFLTALALIGRNLDYERGLSPFEIRLYVTDTWSDPISVPISVTLTDINELVIRRPIDDQRLINGRSTTFDLSQHYTDPEGDVNNL